VELLLNLAGALVAITLISLWLHISPPTKEGAKRSTQLVALALLILILFPVISVTDDLIAAQNPAETDSLQRRSLEVSNLHAATLCPALPLEPYRMPVLAGWQHFAAFERNLPPTRTIALAPIENRPPPMA
jgi:hypothetical protein